MGFLALLCPVQLSRYASPNSRRRSHRSVYRVGQVVRRHCGFVPHFLCRALQPKQQNARRVVASARLARTVVAQPAVALGVFAQGFNSGDQFFSYLKDSFDLLHAEGETAPKMMSIGLHCRLVGRPGRAAALAPALCAAWLGLPLVAIAAAAALGEVLATARALHLARATLALSPSISMFRKVPA
jgi:hypothetical protein